MLTLLVRRLAAAVVLVAVVGLIVFALLDLAPGDAAVSLAGETASAEEIEEVRRRLGLDEHFVVRYAKWLGDAATGDLGTSLYTSRTVASAMLDRLPRTVSLGLLGLGMAVVLAAVLGAIGALRPGRVLDRLVTALTSVMMSVPPFVVGLGLVIVFAVERSWLPATGYVSIDEGGVYEWYRHLILPAIALALIPAAELSRQIRSALLDEMAKDYVRTAQAKGLPRRLVVGKHALKNAAIPVVTVLGLQLGRILGGAVTVEVVFAIGGFGSLAVESVLARDVPMIQGVVVVSVAIVVVANLLVDLSYLYFNPRLRSRQLAA